MNLKWGKLNIERSLITTPLATPIIRSWFGYVETFNQFFVDSTHMLLDEKTGVTGGIKYWHEDHHFVLSHITHLHEHSVHI